MCFATVLRTKTVEFSSAGISQEVECRAHAGHQGGSPQPGQVVAAEMVLFATFSHIFIQ